MSHFWGPLQCFIDLQTLYKSRAKLPATFLRGCGAPESFIARYEALFREPVDFLSCFISYSHADKRFVQKLHTALSRRGIDCWLDEKRLQPGQELYSELDRGIRSRDKILLICSKSSLTSWWVHNEVAVSLEKEQQSAKELETVSHCIIPIDVDGSLGQETCRLAFGAILRSRMTSDFRDWEKSEAAFEQALEKLLEILRITDKK